MRGENTNWRLGLVDRQKGQSLKVLCPPKCKNESRILELCQISILSKYLLNNYQSISLMQIALCNNYAKHSALASLEEVHKTPDKL